MTVKSKLVMAATERKTNIMKAFKIRVNFSAQVSAHDNGHDGVIRIFMGFPENCILQLPTIVEVSAQKMVANRKKKFTSKVSFDQDNCSAGAGAQMFSRFILQLPLVHGYIQAGYYSGQD